MTPSDPKQNAPSPEEPVGTREPIPGYGQAPEGVRTLRLPDEAPRKDAAEEDEDPDSDA